MEPSEFELRAQTNTRLYGQLLAAGYRSDEIVCVRDAYTLATALFAGQLRPEGRPFVCHLVGVASILAMIEASLELIVAGLLHSAYSHGDFGHGRGRVMPAGRDRLRAALGPQTERLLASYSSHPWNRTTVAGWLANVSRLDADVRQIAVIRLADTVEDALDHGLQMSAKASNSNRQIPVQSLVELANALGYPQLGASLKRLLDQPERAPDLSALRNHHAGSYVVCPSSWREKTLPRLIRWAHRVRAES